MARSITLKGFKEYEKRIREGNKTLLSIADAEASASAVNVERLAKQKAPNDLGNLRATINHQQVKKGVWEVVASANYAAYVEFGTRSKVQIPSGLESYAAQFKGKGQGDYFDFLNAILDWVKRKGIVAYGANYSVKSKRRLGNAQSNKDADLEAAQAIADSIMRYGIKAQPYLFPSLREEEPKFLQRLKQALQDL